jgi:hypothetical protein
MMVHSAAAVEVIILLKTEPNTETRGVLTKATAATMVEKASSRRSGCEKFVVVNLRTV